MTSDRKLGLIAAAVVAVTGMLASDGLVRGELATTEALNDLPRPIIDAFEIVMQLGTRPAILLIAAVAAVVSRAKWKQVVVAVVLAGGLAWGASTVAKDVVDRPRPDRFTADLVVSSDASGSGWPSTHAAIGAAALTAAALAAGQRPSTAIALAGLVGVARIAVGVHFPLDVVGGLGLGVAIAVVVVEVVHRR